MTTPNKNGPIFGQKAGLDLSAELHFGPKLQRRDHHNGVRIVWVDDRALPEPYSKNGFLPTSYLPPPLSTNQSKIATDQGGGW